MERRSPLPGTLRRSPRLGMETMRIRAHLVKRQPGRSRRNGIVTAEVEHSIRRSIFHGDFRPGDPLPELHLARKFGVSQAVVREALSALAHAGLVRRFPNKGAFVTSLTPDEIAEHVRLRLMLETTAWLDAAARLTPAGLAGLNGKLKTIERAAAAGDYDEIAQADLEFHREIWRLSGDSTMAKVLDQITAPLFAFVSVRRSQRREDFSHMVPSHRSVIELLRRGDPHEIAQASRAMMEESYAAFLPPPTRGRCRRTREFGEGVTCQVGEPPDCGPCFLDSGAGGEE